MKRRIFKTVNLLFLVFSFALVLAQEDVTVVTPASEAAEGLDLQAVAELFKDSENLEAFEQSLNDPDTGVNNLDLDDDGEVDFIRVMEEVSDDTHVIILQVLLGEDEVQDVATIEVEKSGDESYDMQVHGNEEIYGADYYVAPQVVRVHTWPVITWMYRPGYRPYRSSVYFGRYPGWWRRVKPVSYRVYQGRTLRYRNRKTFVLTSTRRIRGAVRIGYKPRSSVLVRKTTVVRTPRGTKVVRTTTGPRGAKKTTVRKRKK